MRNLSCAVFTLTLLLSATSVQADRKLDWGCTGPYGGFIFRVQVDETNPKRVLAFTTRGNFISENAGVSWKLVPQEHHPFPGSAMILNAGRLWVANEGTLSSSRDGFAEWVDERALPGLLLGTARVPSDPPKTLWVASKPEGTERTAVLLLSGGSPRKIGEIAGQDHRLDHRDALRVHPADPSKLRLIVSIYNDGVTFVFGSEDGGEKWKQWKVPLHLNALAPVPGKPMEWLAVSSPIEQKPSGLVRSLDGGRTFAPVGEDERLRHVRTLMFHPVTGALFLGTYSEGVLESPDLGKTLFPRGEGLGIDNVCALAADLSCRERLYAGTQSGLYRSNDGGKSWQWASKGMTALQSTGIHVLPKNRVLLFEFQQGVRVSSDGGRTWPEFVPGWKEKHGKPYGAEVQDQVILVNTGGIEATGTLSRDAGRTWTNSRLPRLAWMLGMTGPNAFFATQRDGNIRRSRDGIRFERLSDRPEALEGPPVRILRMSKERALIFSPRESAEFDPETGKVEKATELPENSAPDVAAVDPVDPGVLWIGTRDGLLCRKKFPDGEWECRVLREGGTFVGMIADPAKKDRRIAGFLDGTLLISKNGGVDWNPISKKQPFRTAKGLAVTLDRRLLVVADGSVRVLDLAKLED